MTAASTVAAAAVAAATAAADAGGTQHVNKVENGDESHRVIAGSRRSRQNDCWRVTHVGRR